MSPPKKLPKNEPEGKGKRKCPRCPYCHFPICWRHGFYARKGFHRPRCASTKFELLVQRYLCRSPCCGHTFSLLPKDVLPYCRFMLTGLFSILKDREAGRSAYWIARHQWDTTLRVILRTLARIGRMTEWFTELYRAYTGEFEQDFKTLVSLLRKRFSWSRLTRLFFHHFYPSRVRHILNPHNSGSKSP